MPRRGVRLAVAGVTLLVLIVVFAVVLPGAAMVVVVIAALVLCLTVPVGVLVAARRQPKPGRKDFGGRYTYFGPVLGWLNRAPEPSRADPGVARPPGSDYDEITRPPTGG